MRGAEKRVEGDGKKGGRMAEGREEIGGGKGRRELRKEEKELAERVGVKCEKG